MKLSKLELKYFKKFNSGGEMESFSSGKAFQRTQLTSKSLAKLGLFQNLKRLSNPRKKRRRFTVRIGSLRPLVFRQPTSATFGKLDDLRDLVMVASKKQDENRSNFGDIEPFAD